MGELEGGYFTQLSPTRQDDKVETISINYAVSALSK